MRASVEPRRRRSPAKAHRREHRLDRSPPTGKTPRCDPSGWFSQMTSSTGLPSADLHLIV
jgi:hypothetical protein